MKESPKFDYDYIIIGSGFGGSVSALRLTEKGYKVLVLEKGKRFGADDFPRTNWNLKRWMWIPALRFFGIFKLSFFRHVTILSGTGVGGGSLVYANTLAHPKREFFTAPSWSGLADWDNELKEHYSTALRMLGAAPNPRLERGDLALRELGRHIGREEWFEATNVAVCFGDPGATVPDPYFGGEGPERAGCTFCGGCMTGCRFNAKNTLDKNYLFFAERKGARILAESEATDVRPLGAPDGSEGYTVAWRSSTALIARKRGRFTTRGVVFSGGVLGTVKLLLKLKRSSLPRLSERIGRGVRTNSEALTGIVVPDHTSIFSNGLAIGSILHTDENSHLEPVRYSAGSGFWRTLMSPKVQGKTVFARIGRLLADFILHPVRNFRVLFVDDFAKRTQILLFMQTIDTSLRFSKGIPGMKSSVDSGTPPSAFMPEAHELAYRYADLVNGKPVALITETLFGAPTTAHILGGCVMGEDASHGVIDKNHRAFGYANMLICDGSTISANPGVNPSLTITALAERAMGKIGVKETGG